LDLSAFRADVAARGLVLREQVPLAACGTFQLGGPARWVVDCARPADLAFLRDRCRELDLSVQLLGEGSNVLFSDAGWPGGLVRYIDSHPTPRVEAHGIVRVSAAASLDALARWAAEQGWAGLEAFSGIPGTVGGAVVGNAGAWGVQMEHVLDTVRGIGAEGREHLWTAADCGFAYRDSRLKHDGTWVSEVSVRLHAGDPTALLAERTRILAIRAEKHPDWRVTPCIGSFFKNLEPSSAAQRRQAAGWFLEQAGAKQFRVGGAAVFERHANIPIKATADCRAEEVAELARRMREAARATQGVDLEREVRYLGAFAGEAAAPGFF
jgi:UDP-N-acetylmuramate dehydrogenase